MLSDVSNSNFLKYMTHDNIINCAAIGSGIYILKSIFSFISDYFTIKRERNYIHKIVLDEQIKRNVNENSNIVQKQEIAYLCYLKILNNTYSKEFEVFDKERYKLFESIDLVDLEKYLICIENFNLNFKITEQTILKEIFSNLGLNSVDDKNEDLSIDLQ